LRAQRAGHGPGALGHPVTHQLPWSFDPQKSLEGEPRVLDLLGEFIGVVEVRRREPLDPVGGVAVLSLPQVALDDRVEGWIPEETAGQAVEE
jgi:hypothetical protein